MPGLPPPVPSSRPPTVNTPVSFDLAAAERIRSAVLKVEGMGPGTRGGSAGLDQWANSHLFVYCSGGFTAASGGTLGTGTGVICTLASGVLTAGTESITFYNLGGAMSGPVFVLLGWVADVWVAVVAPCS